MPQVVINFKGEEAKPKSVKMASAGSSEDCTGWNNNHTGKTSDK
jgi:hypothetical protein